METRICPKCGSDDINVQYHKDDGYPLGCGYSVFLFNRCREEHLHCFCRFCGYDWCEPVKSKKEIEIIERMLEKNGWEEERGQKKSD